MQCGNTDHVSVHRNDFLIAAYSFWLIAFYVFSVVAELQRQRFETVHVDE